MKNVYLACSEAFHVQVKISGSSELVGNVPEKKAFFQTLPHPEKDICQLAYPYWLLRWVDILHFGSFGFGISCVTTRADLLMAWAAKKQLPSGHNTIYWQD